MKKKLLTLSSRCLVLALALLACAYFCFHYLTDSGFTTLWHPEAGKPFVTELVGDLGILFLFAGIFTRMAAWVFWPGEKE